MLFIFSKFKTGPLPVSTFGVGVGGGWIIQLSCSPPDWVLHELWIFKKTGREVRY